MGTPSEPSRVGGFVRIQCRALLKGPCNLIPALPITLLFPLCCPYLCLFKTSGTVELPLRGKWGKRYRETVGRIRQRWMRERESMTIHFCHSYNPAFVHILKSSHENKVTNISTQTNSVWSIFHCSQPQAPSPSVIINGKTCSQFKCAYTDVF